VKSGSKTASNTKRNPPPQQCGRRLGGWPCPQPGLTASFPALRASLERVPIKWNPLIDKDAAQNQSVEHVRIEKSSNFFGTCSSVPAAAEMSRDRAFARSARSCAIAVLNFCRPDHGKRFAIMSCRAGIGSRNQFRLDLIIDGPVDISSTDIGVKNGLIMAKLLGAGGAIRQFRPVRRSWGLRYRGRDRRCRAGGLIAAAKG